MTEFNWVLDADAICQPFTNLHVFRHGWGHCVCGKAQWPDGARDPVSWLTLFFRNQREVKCTCSTDCDQERDAAETYIKELEGMLRRICQSSELASSKYGGEWREAISRVLGDRL